MSICVDKYEILTVYSCVTCRISIDYICKVTVYARYMPVLGYTRYIHLIYLTQSPTVAAKARADRDSCTERHWPQAPRWRPSVAYDSDTVTVTGTVMSRGSMLKHREHGPSQSLAAAVTQETTR